MCSWCVCQGRELHRTCGFLILTSLLRTVLSAEKAITPLFRKLSLTFYISLRAVRSMWFKAGEGAHEGMCTDLEISPASSQVLLLTVGLCESSFSVNDLTKSQRQQPSSYMFRPTVLTWLSHPKRSQWVSTYFSVGFIPNFFIIIIIICHLPN